MGERIKSDHGHLSEWELTYKHLGWIGRPGDSQFNRRKKWVKGLARQDAVIADRALKFEVFFLKKKK